MLARGQFPFSQFGPEGLKLLYVRTITSTDSRRRPRHHNRATLLGIQRAPVHREWIDTDLLGIGTFVSSNMSIVLRSRHSREDKDTYVSTIRDVKGDFGLPDAAVRAVVGGLPVCSSVATTAVSPTAVSAGGAASAEGMSAAAAAAATCGGRKEDPVDADADDFKAAISSAWDSSMRFRMSTIVSMSAGPEAVAGAEAVAMEQTVG